MPTIDELAARLAVLVPIGSVVAFAGEVEDTGGIVEVPVGSGWLLCNGAPVSSREFRELFDAIQASHGNGQDNVTSPVPLPAFNLPDYRGLFLRGVTGTRTDRDPNSSNAERTANHLGGNIGNRVGSVQGDQVVGHSHTIQGHHLEAQGGRGFEGSGMATNSNPNPAFDRPFPTSSVGGAETRPKNAYVHWIIKARP